MPRYTIQAPDGRRVTVEGDAPPTEADLDGIFSQLPPAEEGPSTLESVGRGAAQGLTFGFGDEITGAVEGAYSALTSDESFGDAYERARDEARAANLAAQEENPWAYGLAEVGSGVLTGGLGAARAVGAKGAATLASRLGRGAAVGAGYGGTAGAGYSTGETPQEVAEDVATGVAAGGVLGAASPAVGRVLQRAINRYGGQGTAQREIQGMFKGSEQAAKDALKQNSDLMVADLGPLSRTALANVMDDDTAARLVTRGGSATRERVLKRAAGMAGKERMGTQTRGGQEIEYSYAGLPKPKTNMQRIKAEYIPDDDPTLKRIWANAERQAARRYGEKSRKYPMAVLHNTQRAMRKNNDSSIRQVGRELTDELTEINPRFRAGQTMYAEGSAIQKAYDELYKQLSSKSAAKFVREGLDPDNVNAQGTIDKIRPMFANDRQFNTFVNSLKDEQAMAATLTEAQLEALADVAPALISRGKSLMEAVKALGIANTADTMLGVNQKLATATAARQLLYRVFDLTPGAGAIGRVLTRKQRQQYENEMRKILTGRKLPQYRPAAARAITSREAAVAGGAGYLAGTE